jgi:hypothetical protein
MPGSGPGLNQDQLAVQNAQKVLEDANASLAATQNTIAQTNQRLPGR